MQVHPAYHQQADICHLKGSQGPRLTSFPVPLLGQTGPGPGNDFLDLGCGKFFFLYGDLHFPFTNHFNTV